MPPPCDPADLFQVLASAGAQVICTNPQHLQKQLQQRWRNQTDITPISGVQKCKKRKKNIKDESYPTDIILHLQRSQCWRKRNCGRLWFFPQTFPFFTSAQQRLASIFIQLVKGVHLEFSQQPCSQKSLGYTCLIHSTTTTITNQPSEDHESQMWWWHLQGAGGAWATMWCKRGAAFSSSGLSSSDG